MPTPPNDPTAPDPLILTAALADADFAILDGLRRRHFPAALNKVPAHISLFHHLPGAALGRVREFVVGACRRVTGPLDLAPRGLRNLGRGVAIRYGADGLLALRAALADQFAPWLTPQDRQTFDPHVTIQNKVRAQDARALLESWDAQPLPGCQVTGLSLWFYRGGPWEHVETTCFGPQSVSPRL